MAAPCMKSWRAVNLEPMDTGSDDSGNKEVHKALTDTKGWY